MVNYNAPSVAPEEEHYELCIKNCALTKFLRVERHGINLDVLREVSHLTWECVHRGYSLDDYEQHLQGIRSMKRNYTPWQVAVGGGLAYGGFCIQFGCDWVAFFYASIAAALGLRLRMFLNEKGSNPYVNIGVAAFVSTLIAFLLALFSESAAHFNSSILQPLTTR